MLNYFDMKLPTELVVDASPRGLGEIITQKKTDGEISTSHSRVSCGK